MFDDKLKNLSGVKFFISCITGTTSHALDKDIRTGISYYICFNNTVDTDLEKIFALFHDNNFDVVVSKIKYKKIDDDIENLLVQLKQVVKVKFQLLQVFTTIVFKFKIFKCDKKIFILFIFVLFLFCRQILAHTYVNNSCIFVNPVKTFDKLKFRGSSFQYQ